MRLRRTLVTAALGGTLALTAMATSAQASSVAPSTSASIGTSTTWAPGHAEYYSTYSSKAACENAGVTGDIHGRWSSWSCTKTLRGWDLWVTYF
ncbi:hypothetical protein [Streptomyces sp. NPDC005970]|uniref:hypothetical protein n=1 Tax=Streptomyces sp. NPDC005970 TaxID=3156723 RepID=UPI0034069786